jgi:hypothetical protein
LMLLYWNLPYEKSFSLYFIIVFSKLDRGLQIFRRNEKWSDRIIRSR